MGYNTDFKGELKFTNELTATQLAELKNILGEDCRDHKDWGRTDLTHINLRLLDDFTGVCWDTSEKTYDMVEKIELIIQLMRRKYPNFGLKGQFLAQGKYIEDRYTIIVNDDKVTVKTQEEVDIVSETYTREEVENLIRMAMQERAYTPQYIVNEFYKNNLK
ncbi:MAG: hypothetical protein KC414_03415 [Romboutsia sp.]|nr:hypothetical protein [Romboutsia sp.]